MAVASAGPCALQTDNHANTSSLIFTGRMLFLTSNQQRQGTDAVRTEKWQLNLGWAAAFPVSVLTAHRAVDTLRRFSATTDSNINTISLHNTTRQQRVPTSCIENTSKIRETIQTHTGGEARKTYRNRATRATAYIMNVTHTITYCN